MNILKTLLAYIMVVFLLSGCGGDNVPEKLLPPALPSVTATVDGRTIVLTAEFRSDDNLEGITEYGFYFGSDEENLEQLKMTDLKERSYSLSKGDLEYSTSYFYKVWVSNGRDEIASDLKAVKTGEAPVDGIIQFKDPLVKDICVANWDLDGDGELSKAEAANVIDLGHAFESTDIVSFNELECFTNLRVCFLALCHKLSEVKLPDSILQISGSCFSECWELKLTSLPKNLTQMGEWAFHQCKNVRFTFLPDGLETIGWYAFAGADNIELTKLPSSLISIGSAVFAGKQGVLPEDLPASLKMIGASAFGGIKNFNPKSIPSGVSEIGEGAFDGCEALSWTKLPDYLVKIGENTFRNCWHLAATELPSGLREIGNNAFENCYFLNITELPDGLFTIGDGAFKNCGIKNLSIPASVDHIGAEAFYGCYPSIVKIHASEPPEMLDTYLGNRAEAIYVPKQSIQKYESAANWSKWKGKYKALSDDDTPEPPTPDENNIQFKDPAVKAICISNWDKDGDGELSYEEAAEVRTIGSAFSRRIDIRSFKEFEYFTGLTFVPDGGFSGCRYLIDLKLPSNVLQIGNGAFSDCYELALESLPAGIVKIGEGAFINCHNLMLTELPLNVTRIETNTFSDCGKLRLTELPSGITYIGDTAFWGNGMLALKSLPTEITYIGHGAFQYCKSMTLTELPPLLENIYSGSFYECSNIQIKFLPDNIKSIEKEAFSGCAKLELETLPDNLINIGFSAFSGCENLKINRIPELISSINERTFEHCIGIKSIELPENLASISANAFSDCRFKEITIPAKVTRIDTDAFKDCYWLATVKMLPETPPELSDENIGNYADVIYVPAASLEAYHTASGWSRWKDKFQPIASE